MMPQRLRSRLLRLVAALGGILAVPAILAGVVFSPRTGRITYTRLELGVTLAAVTVWLTTIGFGLRSLAQIILYRIRPQLEPSPEATSWRWLCAVAAALALGAIPYARYVEPRWIEVTTQELPNRHVNGRVRLVIVSDMHSDARFDLDGQVTEKVNILAPDLVLFLGDALNKASRLQAFQAAMRSMRAKAGKYAIRGNWDAWYWSNLDLFRGTGFREITAGVETLAVNGTSLRILGHTWSDRWLPDRIVPVQEPFEGVTIMVYHSHDYAEVAAQRGVDLYLCGDTHGGQIALPIWGPLLAIGHFGRRYSRGLYPIDGMNLYVTRGIGVEKSIPVRFGARPEIAVIDLVPLPRADQNGTQSGKNP